MRKIFSFTLFCWMATIAFAQPQPATQEDTVSLPDYERALVLLSDSLINAGSEANRGAASLQMIRAFSRALRKETSFSYPFSALKSVAIISAPDSLFRILTWQLSFDNGTNRYFGVIQTNEAKPKLYPLVDYGDFYEHPDSVIVDHDRWIGALYFQILPKKVDNRTFYTLFGWNAHNLVSNKKLIDILWFDEQDGGKPKFGYPLFRMLKGNSPSRIIFEYKKDATMSLTFIPEEQTIYYDHLVTLGGQETSFKFDQVPDGTLEGLKWERGLWKQIDMIDYEKREDGDVPNVIEERTTPLYRPLQPR